MSDDSKFEEFAEKFIEKNGASTTAFECLGMYYYEQGHKTYLKNANLKIDFQNKFSPNEVDEKKDANDTEYLRKYEIAYENFLRDDEVLKAKCAVLHDKAIHYFDRLEHFKLDTLTTKYYKAESYLDKEDFREALIKIDEIIAEDPKFKVEYQQTNDFKIIESVTAKKAYVLYRLAFTSKDDRFYESAIKHADIALENDPQSITARCAKTNSLYCLGRLEEYEESFNFVPPPLGTSNKEKDIVTIDPNEPMRNKIDWRDVIKNSKEYVWLMDAYVNEDEDFRALFYGIKSSGKFKEIRILTGFIGPLHTVESDLMRVDEIKKQSKLLKKHFKNISITVRMAKLNQDIHDRFLFSKDRVWNTVSGNVVTQNNLSNICKLNHDQEAVETATRWFNKYWDDEKTLQLHDSEGGKNEINEINNVIYKKWGVIPPHEEKKND